MESNLLWQGVELMFAGIGTVFVFLALLVLATSLMSYLVQRLEPAPAPPSGPDDAAAEEIAAITAAIALHRRGR